jgi:hypothetical protein
VSELAHDHAYSIAEFNGHTEIRREPSREKERQNETVPGWDADAKVLAGRVTSSFTLASCSGAGALLRRTGTGPFEANELLEQIEPERSAK